MQNSQKDQPAPPAPGLRERKKQQTRLDLSQIATRLFIARGFDRVTVAEVAAEANVSVNTIFNYFATKEELFFDRGREVIEASSQIVRARRPGEPIIDALSRELKSLINGSKGRSFATTITPFIATIDASPALTLRTRLLRDESERMLAETLAIETGAVPGDPTPRVVAALLTGLQWMLVQEFCARLLAGEADAKVRAAVARAAERGFERLRAGVGDYGARTPAPRRAPPKS